MLLLLHAAAAGAGAAAKAGCQRPVLRACCPVFLMLSEARTSRFHQRQEQRTFGHFRRWWTSLSLKSRLGLVMPRVWHLGHTEEV